MTREAITRRMLHAIEKTWEGLDREGAIEGPAHNWSVVVGGCEAFLHGRVQLPYDAISLALSLLTLAREDTIARGGVLPHELAGQPEEGEVS